MFAESVGYPGQAYRADLDGLAANPQLTSVASAQWLEKCGDEHEIPIYGDSANLVVTAASATAPPQLPGPILSDLKGKQELQRGLKRRPSHRHGHRRRVVD